MHNDSNMQNKKCKCKKSGRLNEKFSFNPPPPPPPPPPPRIHTHTHTHTSHHTSQRKGYFFSMGGANYVKSRKGGLPKTPIKFPSLSNHYNFAFAGANLSGPAQFLIARGDCDSFKYCSFSEQRAASRCLPCHVTLRQKTLNGSQTLRGSRRRRGRKRQARTLNNRALNNRTWNNRTLYCRTLNNDQVRRVWGPGAKWVITSITVDTTNYYY